jgi:hypothetical protein
MIVPLLFPRYSDLTCHKTPDGLKILSLCIRASLGHLNANSFHSNGHPYEREVHLAQLLLFFQSSPGLMKPAFINQETSFSLLRG